MFDDLDQLLGKECSEDAWSDYFILVADKIVADFSEEDWRHFASVWRDKPENWQYRCVQVIGDIQRPDVLSILLEMEAGPYEEVEYYARGELRNSHGMKF